MASMFIDKAPDDRGGTSVGNSVPREMHARPCDWPMGRRASLDPAIGADHVDRHRSDAAPGRNGARWASRCCSNTA